MYVADTIAAISTPIGEGGIGIIRVSGPESLKILQSIFRHNSDGGLISHRFYYGNIIEPCSGDTLDEVLVVYMKAPNSFTREDVVEIHCHGGTLVLDKVLKLVLAKGGHLATPGEFTKRAFLNGRIDLLQAEAIIDIIRGKTDIALSVAQHQRAGALSEKFLQINNSLKKSLALFEAYIDFPDDEIGEHDNSLILAEVNSAEELALQLLSTYEEGRVIRDGVSVIIAGKPNVGKSSLLNALLQEQRAIVTSLPGTTRDLIEEIVNVNGLPVKLLDTAGIRKSGNLVEQEGIRMALERISTADLVLFLLDSSKPFDKDDEHAMEAFAASKLMLVLNKNDLPEKIVLPEHLKELPFVSISTLTGSGLNELKKQITDMFLHGKAVDSREYAALSRARHRDSLVKALEAIQRFKLNFEIGAPSEITSIDLGEALNAIGEITGETTPEDILDIIFGQFCIGK